MHCFRDVVANRTHIDRLSCFRRCRFYCRCFVVVHDAKESLVDFRAQSQQIQKLDFHFNMKNALSNTFRIRHLTHNLTHSLWFISNLLIVSRLLSLFDVLEDLKFSDARSEGLARIHILHQNIKQKDNDDWIVVVHWLSKVDDVEIISWSNVFCFRQVFFLCNFVLQHLCKTFQSELSKSLSNVAIILLFDDTNFDDHALEFVVLILVIRWHFLDSYDLDLSKDLQLLLSQTLQNLVILWHIFWQSHFRVTMLRTIMTYFVSFVQMNFLFHLQLLKTRTIESSMFDLIICEHVLTKATLRTRNRSLVVDIRSCVEDWLLRIFDKKSCFDDCLLSMNMNLRLIWQTNWDNSSRRDCNVFARSNSRRDNCKCKSWMISIAHFLSN